MEEEAADLAEQQQRSTRPLKREQSLYQNLTLYTRSVTKKTTKTFYKRNLNLKSGAPLVSLTSHTLAIPLALARLSRRTLLLPIPLVRRREHK